MNVIGGLKQIARELAAAHQDFLEDERLWGLTHPDEEVDMQANELYAPELADYEPFYDGGNDASLDEWEMAFPTASDNEIDCLQLLTF